MRGWDLPYLIFNICDIRSLVILPLHHERNLQEEMHSTPSLIINSNSLVREARKSMKISLFGSV